MYSMKTNVYISKNTTLIKCFIYPQRTESMIRRGRKKESEFVQSCPTLCGPMDCSLPGSSLHGVLQARVLEWVAISFSRGSSQPRDRTWASCIPGRHFNLWDESVLLAFSRERTAIAITLQEEGHSWTMKNSLTSKVTIQKHCRSSQRWDPISGHSFPTDLLADKQAKMVSVEVYSM